MKGSRAWARGSAAITDKWIKPLNDTIHCSLPGYHPIAVRELARPVDIAKKVLPIEGQADEGA